MANTMLLHLLSVHMVLLSYVKPSARACAGHWYSLVYYYNSYYFLNQKGYPPRSSPLCCLPSPDLPCQVQYMRSMNTAMLFFLASWSFDHLQSSTLPAPESCHQIILSLTLPFSLRWCVSLLQWMACYSNTSPHPSQLINLAGPRDILLQRDQVLPTVPSTTPQQAID